MATAGRGRDFDEDKYGDATYWADAKAELENNRLAILLGYVKDTFGANDPPHVVKKFRNTGPPLDDSRDSRAQLSST